MKITFLGTGSSLGVPITGCFCDVCISSDIKDKRLRSSVMIDIDETRIIIDAGPDFREQMLRYNPELKIDAILLTHAHRDHIAGLDDIRPLNFIYKKPASIYAENNVLKIVQNMFFYSFEKSSNKSVPKFDINEITLKPFYINKIKIIPIRVFHSMDILGFRINNFTYITDAKFISENEIKKIMGTEILVVNAIQLKKHYSHFNLEEALNFIEKINPRKAYLTHIAHRLGKYNSLIKNLPQNIVPAYDGLTIDIF